MRQIYPISNHAYQLVGLLALSIVGACTENTDTRQVDAAVGAALREATTDTQAISSGELTATLDTYDNERGKHTLTDKMGLTGGTQATISRNHQPFVVIMPEDESYSIGIFNPDNKEEMIANISIDTGTGHLTSISYSSRSADGDWFNATDGNVDGQPETIIVYDREDMSRVWLQDGWRPIVKQDGIAGVMLDGQWHRLSRDADTMQWDLLDSTE